MIYYKINGEGKKIYTLDETDAITVLPAKFSIEDKNSEYRIENKRRFKIFPFDE